MTPPPDARCPNCGGYPRTEAQLAWKAAHPRSQRRWCRMRMRCLYRATDPSITFAVPRDRQGRRILPERRRNPCTDDFDPPGREYTVGDAIGLRREP